MRIDRLLSITIMLLNRDRIPARELAEKFEVSVRTIYRDIDAINLAGIPIISYPGNNGGFGIMENYRIDSQVLSMPDILAVLTALKGINAVLDNRELENAINKISSIVPREKNKRMRNFGEELVIDILPWGQGKKEREKLQTVNRAVSNSNFLDFVYTNTQGEQNRRTVEPMTLIFKGHAWYLFAWCCLRRDYRLFKISRMKDPLPLERKFIRREVSYEAYFSSEEQQVRMAHLDLKFFPGAASRVEEFFEPDQITRLPGGELMVKVSFPDTGWIYSFILSFGELVEVTGPPHIRKKIAEKAKKISTLYKPDTGVSQA
jgi:predicted DNA-binding transcriptional regulator YafY